MRCAFPSHVPCKQMMVIEAEQFEFLGDLVVETNDNGEFALQVCTSVGGFRV